MRTSLAILSGLLVSLAFPSWARPALDPRLGILAWFALAPLLYAIDEVPKKRAFLLGWISGSVFFASTLYWIAIINEMEYLAIPAWLAVSAFLGLFWAVWAWGVSASGNRAWIAAPALWVILEWLRGHIFTGFPWAILGTTQWGFPQVFMSSRYTGALAVSFAIVAVNMAVLKFRRKGLFRVPAVVVAVYSIGILAVLSFIGAFAVKQDISGKPTVKIALLQGNFTETEKWSLPMDVMISRYEMLAKQAGREKAVVTVWPETATAGELSRDPITSARLVKLAKQTGSVQVVGAILLENGHYYNAAYVATSTGITVPFRKTHLVPFGEYIPGFVRTMLPFARKLTEGVIDYTPGFSLAPAETGPVKSGVQVCYESIFPEIARAQARMGAEVFFNLTNDAWYLRSAATYQHALGPITRSVECGRWLVRCANTGLSFACSPYGRTYANMAIFETGYQAMEIVPIPRVTACARFGDIPVMLACFLALCLAFIPAGPAKSRV